MSCMRSAVHDLLPRNVRRSLIKLGGDLQTARRKRRLTAAMVAERTGVSLATYHRVERGDSKVAISVYAMALFVLGFGAQDLGDLADPGSDDQGLLLDLETLPKRVRTRKAARAT
jgi:transcriptional regulator with XRE-family HTH domain